MLPAKVEAFRNLHRGKSAEELLEIAAALFEEKGDLQVRYTELQNTSTQMTIQFQQAKGEVKDLRVQVEELTKLNQHLTGVKDKRTQELFGRSSEKTDDILKQALNGETPLEDPLDDRTPEEAGSMTDEKSHPDGSDKPDTDTDTGSKEHGEKPPRKLKEKGKRDRDLSGLPVQAEYMTDFEFYNEMFGVGEWRIAFWERRRTVEVVRQFTYVREEYRPVLSVGLDHAMYRLPDPRNLLLPKTLASPSLVAQIMTDHYSLFLPWYRQAHDPDRFGFPLSCQQMCYWSNRIADEHLRPVYDYMCAMLKKIRYQQCDETTWTVIIDGRDTGSISYIWVHRSSELLEGPQIVVYCYEKTRGTDHLRHFFSDLEEQLFLTCDAYAAYPCFASESNGLVVICGCFMHCRRPFVDAVRALKIDESKITREEFRKLPEVKALLLIREIYLADEPLKALPAAERLEKRKVIVTEKVDAFFNHVHSIDLSDPSISEKLRDAVRYALNQEVYLRQFLTDGNIPLDNGATERDVKPIALERRNSLFSFTIRGAETNVIINTLIQTAKANGADPYYYLKYLLEEMPKYLYAKGTEHLPDMMPWSDAYKAYVVAEKQRVLSHLIPPGNEKPRTPRKRDLKKTA